MTITHRARASVILTGIWILALSFLVHPGLIAADAWDAAKARHVWAWFRLSEVQARDKAQSQCGTLVVERRDGQPQPSAGKLPAGLVVTAHLDGGRVLWVQATDGATMHTEGVAEVALLRWLGLPEAEVLAQARAAGRNARIVARDGEQFAVTLDYHAERLNLYLRKGVVVAITLG
jgi:hypothetical protein